MEQKTSRRKTAGKQESFRSLAAVSLILLMVTGLIFGASVLRRRAAGVLTNAKVSVFPRVAVVIDPGHGGFDGGAVGIDGSVEKEINLSLSLTLRDFLTVMGYAPKMTRETDISLDGNTDAPLRQRKREDLRARLSVMEEATDGKVLMIHQNQFTDPRYSGAQMFYGKSPGSEELAGALRRRIRETIQPENERECKPSEGNVWLLEQCTHPIVLVECGFLSNPEECARLSDAAYQRQLAFVIACSLGK